MRHIPKMLAVGWLTLALLLGGCGTAAVDDFDDETEEVVEEMADPIEEGEPEATLDPDAPIASLDGWWQIERIELVAMTAAGPFGVPGADGEMIETVQATDDAAFIDDFDERFHTATVFKVDALAKTFEATGYSLSAQGTVDDSPTDGWFGLDAEAGAGVFGSATDFRCRVNDDGTLTLEVVLASPDPEVDTGVTNKMVYTGVRADEYEDLDADESVLTYAYDRYMDFRNANEDLPITWLSEPRMIAENDEVAMLLWGSGETDEAYVILTGFVNKGDRPLLVANSYTARPLVANDYTQVSPEFGCYLLPGHGRQAFDCPLSVPKAGIEGGLYSLAGTIDLTTINLAAVSSLDFVLTF